MFEISSSMNKCKDENTSHANLTAKLTYWPYRLNYTTPSYLTGVFSSTQFSKEILAVIGSHESWVWITQDIQLRNHHIDTTLQSGT